MLFVTILIDAASVSYRTVAGDVTWAVGVVLDTVGTSWLAPAVCV